MFGWRARIGLILPADNVVAEPELYSLGLPGVSFHAVRLLTTAHDAMRSEAAAVASALTEMGVDIVVYGCAETSFDAGDQGRKQLSTAIEEACGLPVVTATSAMLSALAELEVRRLALVTPYSKRSGLMLEQTLADNGIEVLAATHRDFREGSPDPREWYETNRQPVTIAYEMMRGLRLAKADALLVSATNIASLGIVEQAERDFGKPVVTSNQAVAWWCLRELGIKDPIGNFGSLLRRPR